MSDSTNALAGAVLLLGDQVRSTLAKAMETQDLAKVWELLKQADYGLELIIQTARATQPDIEEETSGPQ